MPSFEIPSNGVSIVEGGTGQMEMQFKTEDEIILDAMKQNFKNIITLIGEDTEREGLHDTPKRISKFYKEVFSGLHEDPKQYLETGFDEEDHQELVLVKDIPFYSMCEHHFVPFFGVAHVAYVPNGRIVGLSKLARLVDGYARRPQVQERLTSQVAEAIVDVLRPTGCAVIISARHMCMEMRGIKKPGASTVTSAMRGSFMEYPSLRSELMNLIKM